MTLSREWSRTALHAKPTALATIQTPSRWLPYHLAPGILSTWTSVVLFLQESICSLSSTHTHDSLRLWLFVRHLLAASFHSWTESSQLMEYRTWWEVTMVPLSQVKRSGSTCGRMELTIAESLRYGLKLTQKQRDLWNRSQKQFALLIWKARRGGSTSTSFFSTIEQHRIAQQDLHQQNCSSIEKFETNCQGEGKWW